MMKMNVHEILKYLPHRYPFLLVDRVLECKMGESILALKNVSYNEPFFQGHFPGAPVMPGVLILEALAQTAGLLALSNPEWRPDDDSLYLFVGINKARFKRQVSPGDQLHLDVRLIRHKRDYGVFDVKATVNGGVVTTAEIMCVFKSVDTQ